MGISDGLELGTGLPHALVHQTQDKAESSKSLGWNFLLVKLNRESNESSLPVEAAFPPPLEEINPELPEEMVKASPKVVALQDDSDSPQDLPLSPLFTSRPITRLKFQQVPKDEEQSANHTPKEVHDFSNLFRQKSGICVGMDTEGVG